MSRWQKYFMIISALAMGLLLGWGKSLLEDKSISAKIPTWAIIL